MLNKDGNRKLIFNKYKVKKLIHSSGFAEVYEGFNEKDKISVAMKFENRKSNYNILQSEAFLLMNLKGYGIPKLITYGIHGQYNILIEELLGKSLGHIYDKMAEDKFNIKDICMIALQSLDRLEFLHSKLVIHRDIKPYNLVIGRHDPNIIYLIDFGLSRKYRSSRTGKHVKFKNLNLTFGSLRYLSINGNKGYEQSRRDDLESLGYMLIFLATGDIPWLLAEKVNINVVKKYLLVYKIKKMITTEKLCIGLPEEMAKYINYCKGLYFEQDPDYNYLRSLFTSILMKNKLKNDLNFSWSKMLIKGRNERSQSKNKIRNKRSVSPHIRLLNKIKKSLQNTKSNKDLNNNQNYQSNPGFISHFNRPISFLYRDNDDNNINIEKDNSFKDLERKNSGKIKKNIEVESTKENDIKGLNTDKSLSTSMEKRDFKKKRRTKNKINLFENEVSKLNIETPNNNNIDNVDEEENKIFEFNYEDVKAKNNGKIIDEYDNNPEIKNLYQEYNDIIDFNNINNMDTQINVNIEKYLGNSNFQKNNVLPKSENNYKNIKFISNSNFWEEGNEEENGNNEFNTYNDIDLNPFGFSNLYLNDSLNKKNHKIYFNDHKKNREKSNNPLEHFSNNPKKINNNLNNINIQNYQAINKNIYYTKNNVIPNTIGKLNINNFVHSKDKSNILGKNKSGNKIMKSNNSFNKVQNAQKNKFHRNKKITLYNNNNKSYNYISYRNNDSIPQIKNNANLMNFNINYSRKFNNNISPNVNIQINKTKYFK